MFLRFALSSCAVCAAVPWIAPGADTPTVDVTLGASDGAYPEVSAFIAHVEGIGESKAAAAMRSDVAAFNSELRSAKLRIATAAERFVAATRSNERQQVERGAAFLTAHRAAQASQIGSTIEIDVAAPTQQFDFASVSGVLNKFGTQLSVADDGLFSAWPADFSSLTDFVVRELESGLFVATAPAVEGAQFGSEVGEHEAGYQTAASMLEGLGSRRGTAAELAVASHLRLQVSLLVRENALVREALRAALAAAEF